MDSTLAARKFGPWLVAVFLLVLMLEYAPKVGGLLLLALTLYLATQLERKGSLA